MIGGMPSNSLSGVDMTPAPDSPAPVSDQSEFTLQSKNTRISSVFSETVTLKHLVLHNFKIRISQVFSDTFPSELIAGYPCQAGPSGQLLLVTNNLADSL